MDKHGRPESCHGLRPLPSEGRASGRGVRPLRKPCRGKGLAPAAMMPGRAMAVMVAVVAGAVVMAVDGVAAQRAYAAADESAGQRVAIEGGGEAGTSHSANGCGGKHAMFTRAAGRKAEAEQADEAEADEAAHDALLCGAGWPCALRSGSFLYLCGMDSVFSGVRAGGAALCAEAGEEESRKDRIPGCS